MRGEEESVRPRVGGGEVRVGQTPGHMHAFARLTGEGVEGRQASVAPARRARQDEVEVTVHAAECADDAREVLARLECAAPQEVGGLAQPVARAEFRHSAVGQGESGDAVRDDVQDAGPDPLPDAGFGRDRRGHDHGVGAGLHAREGAAEEPIAPRSELAGVVEEGEVVDRDRQGEPGRRHGPRRGVDDLGSRSDGLGARPQPRIPQGVEQAARNAGRTQRQAGQRAGRRRRDPDRVDPRRQSRGEPLDVASRTSRHRLEELLGDHRHAYSHAASLAQEV